MAAGHSLKAAVKQGAKAVIWAAAWPFPSRCPGSRILTYHSVGIRNHEMNVAPDAFRSQMEWLVANHPVIPLSKAAGGTPGVAITFDDGYRDVLQNAVPVLKKLGLPATIFIVSASIGGVLDHDIDPTTSALMNRDEIKTAQAMGMEIGAHGLTHTRLAQLQEDDQHREIAECRRILEEVLGHPPQAFAYPYGAETDYSNITMRLVENCGFRYAVSNRYGANPHGADRLALRRIWIDATDTLAMFKAKVTGRLDLLAMLDSRVGLRARKLLNTGLRTG